MVKGSYHVVIKATGNAQNGYCKIVIGDAESGDSVKYYTIQMSTDENVSDNQLEFVVECYNDNAELHIIPNWGSCSEKEETKIGYDDSKKLIQIGNPKPVTDSKEETSSGETDDGSGEALQEVDVIE